MIKVNKETLDHYDKAVIAVAKVLGKEEPEPEKKVTRRDMMQLVRPFTLLTSKPFIPSHVDEPTSTTEEPRSSPSTTESEGGPHLPSTTEEGDPNSHPTTEGPPSGELLGTKLSTTRHPDLFTTHVWDGKEHSFNKGIIEHVFLFHLSEDSFPKEQSLVIVTDQSEKALRSGCVLKFGTD